MNNRYRAATRNATEIARINSKGDARYWTETLIRSILGKQIQPLVSHLTAETNDCSALLYASIKNSNLRRTSTKLDPLLTFSCVMNDCISDELQAWLLVHCTASSVE